MSSVRRLRGLSAANAENVNKGNFEKPKRSGMKQSRSISDFRDIPAVQTENKENARRARKRATSRDSGSNAPVHRLSRGSDSGNRRTKVKGATYMPVNFKQDGWVMNPIAVEAVRRLYPNFEPRDESKKVRTVSEMTDRVDELERLVEKLVMEKEDAYDILSDQVQAFEEKDEKQIAKIHSAKKDAEVLIDQQREVSTKLAGFETDLNYNGAMLVQYLRHLQVQQRAIIKLTGDIAPPVRNAALVFCRIEGASELWEKEPLVMRAASELYNETLLYNLKLRKGYFVKSDQESCLAAFASPVDAVNCAVSIQQQLLFADWPEELSSYPQAAKVFSKKDAKGRTQLLFNGLRIRMGIHWGPAKAIQGGKVITKDEELTKGPVEYLGPSVKLAAALEAAGSGGQILMSDETYLSVRQHLRKGTFAYCRGLGEIQLHNASNMHIHSIVPIEATMRQFPPPKAAIANMGFLKDRMQELAKVHDKMQLDLHKLSKSQHEISSAATRLRLRLRKAIAEHVPDTRQQLIAAVDEMDALVREVETTSAAFKKQAEVNNTHLQKHRDIERALTDTTKSVKIIPRLYGELKKLQEDHLQLIKSSQDEAIAYEGTIEELEQQVDAFNAQFMDTQMILKELKKQYRREQLQLHK